MHEFIHTVCNITLYITMVELLYYGYHYWIHHSPFYKLIHAKHHESIQVYPMDTFYLEFWDMQSIVVSMSIPMFFVNLNMNEHIVTLYYYITVGYLSHSDAFYTHHETHHKYFKCNYCFTLPIVDKIFGTYRE
jgi:sterol desaturase/sphingolipid hydroxylase (fatty acid hydroxylase superfamily)